MKFKTLTYLSVAAALLCAAPVMAATDGKIAATDERGSAVFSTNGNCVRTKWDGSKDICAKAEPVPAPAPAPEPAPEPEPVVEAPKPEPVKIKLAKELTKAERSVYFEFDKTAIKSEEQAKLDSLATVLLSDKEVESVKIVAYADKMGSEEYNDKLSQKRAQAVNDYLNAKGYLKTTVAETAWLGETAPKTTCPDKMKRAEKIACLAEDRRAEVVINYFNVVQVPAEPAPAAETPATSPELAPVPDSSAPASEATPNTGGVSAPAIDAPAEGSAQ